MKVLVTGASGFVGTHLVPRLLREGHEVTALWNFRRPDYPCTVIQGDLQDSLFTSRVTTEQDIVIHLASEMAIRPSQSKGFVERAEKMMRNLVAASEKNKVKKFLFTSSTMALGATSRGEYLIEEDSQSAVPDWHQLVNVRAKRSTEEILLNSCLHSLIVYSGLLYGAGDWRKSIRRANLPILRGRMPFYFSGGVNINSIEKFIDGLILVLERARPGSRYILGGENITNQKFFELLARSASQPCPKRHFSDSFLRWLAKINRTFKINSSVSKDSVETLLAYHWCDSKRAIQELSYQPGSAEAAIQNSTNWILQNERI